MAVARDHNAGEHIHEFLSQPIDVVCPRCDGPAIVMPLDGKTAWGTPRRLVCTSCGLVREHRGRVTTFSSLGADPWFGLPLWRRVATAHGTVWAYNADHRAQLRSFIAADLRERSSTGGWRGKLPGWMTSAAHRTAVLKAIDSMP